MQNEGGSCRIPVALKYHLIALDLDTLRFFKSVHLILLDSIISHFGLMSEIMWLVN
jgi:hypothetical protein